MAVKLAQARASKNKAPEGDGPFHLYDLLLRRCGLVRARAQSGAGAPSPRRRAPYEGRCAAGEMGGASPLPSPEAWRTRPQRPVMAMCNHSGVGGRDPVVAARFGTGSQPFLRAASKAVNHSWRATRILKVPAGPLTSAAERRPAASRLVRVTTYRSVVFGGFIHRPGRLKFAA